MVQIMNFSKVSVGKQQPFTLWKNFPHTLTNYYMPILVFSSPVRKYRKSYGVVVSVRVVQMLKFLVKVFISLYLLNMLMDQVDTLHDSRYWSEVLCCTITTHPG